LLGKALAKVPPSRERDDDPVGRSGSAENLIAQEAEARLVMQYIQAMTFSGHYWLVSVCLVNVSSEGCRFRCRPICWGRNAGDDKNVTKAV